MGHRQNEDSDGHTPKIPRPRRSLRPKRDDDSYEYPPGSVSRSRFAAVFGTASVLFIIAGVSFFGIGMVLGASLGPGLGGFVAQFENVSYTDGDADIYPVLGDHAACADAPQMEANLVGTTLLDGNVKFYKDLPLPDNFAPNRIARVSIVANSGGSPTEVSDLNLRLTALSANSIELGNTTIREFGPSSYEVTGDSNDSFAPPGDGSLDRTDPAKNVPEFGIDAETFVLPDGGVAAAHQVSLGSINLQNLDLYVAIDEKSDFSNPVERVVEPTNRTCDSLADAM